MKCTLTLKNRSKKVLYIRNKAYLCAGLVAILEYTEQPLIPHYLPIRYSALLRVEVDANLHYRQVAERKFGGIVFEVDLLNGCRCILVELQLYDVESCPCGHHHIYTSSRCVHLYVKVFELSKQGHDDVEHLLIVAL